MRKIVMFVMAMLMTIGMTVGASAQAHAYTAFAKCTSPGGGYVQSTSWWNTNGTKTYHWYIKGGTVDVTGPFNVYYKPKQVLIGSKSVYYQASAEGAPSSREGYYTTGVLPAGGPTAFYVTGKWHKLSYSNGYWWPTTYTCKTSTFL